jgi:hypothetical protein
MDYGELISQLTLTKPQVVIVLYFNVSHYEVNVNASHESRPKIDLNIFEFGLSTILQSEEVMRK